MNKRLFHIGCVMMLFLTGAAMAAVEKSDLCGVYDIQGWEPDGDTCSTPDYIGAIEIAQKGEVYVYEGSADNIRYEGIGFAEQGGRVLLFSYRGGDGETGITRCENMNGVWVCRWVPMGTPDGKPGREIWKKQVLPVAPIVPEETK